jgi:hypothetical protein
MTVTQRRAAGSPGADALVGQLAQQKCMPLKIVVILQHLLPRSISKHWAAHLAGLLN